MMIEATKPKPSDTARRMVARELVMAGGLAFVNGVSAADRRDLRAALPEWVEMQTEKIFSNLDAIMELHGMTRKNIVSVRVHLAHFDRLHERMNHAYLDCLSTVSNLPTRSCIGVAALPHDALVEMDFVLEKRPA